MTACSETAADACQVGLVTVSGGHRGNPARFHQRIKLSTAFAFYAVLIRPIRVVARSVRERLQHTLVIDLCGHDPHPALFQAIDVRALSAFVFFGGHQAVFKDVTFEP